MTRIPTWKFLCLGFAAIVGVSAPTVAADGPNPVVVLDTSKGPITIELDPQASAGERGQFPVLCG